MATNVKAPKAKAPQTKASNPNPPPQKNTKSSANTNTPKTGNKKSVGRPHETHPLKTFHEAAAGETRNSPYTNPNIIFFAGGALLIAADIERIKKVFGYAWGNLTVADASKNPLDFWKNLKVILSQLLFLFIITMTARVIPPLGRVWLIVIIGLWILYLMKNPQVLQLLQAAGQP